MTFEEKLQFVSLIRADYYEERNRLLSAAKRAREPFEDECLRLIRAATTHEEANAVCKLAPPYTKVKRAALLRLIEFTTSLEELRELSHRSYRWRGYRFGLEYDEADPTFSKWVELSIAEVDAASSVNELLRARDRCPAAPDEYSGRNPYREATDRLEQPFNECQSSEDLEVLRKQYEGSQGTSYDVWWWSAYERAYLRLNGKEYERRYFSF